MVFGIKKIVFATKNKNKLKEVSLFLEKSGIEVCGVPEEFDPEETGETFTENAVIKAVEAARLSGLPAFGDDSGLVVDALDGRPGVYSSRYAENDSKRIAKLLDELKNTPDELRTARFVCAMAIATSEGKVLYTTEGKCEGKIINDLRGANGFGYDPVFYIPQFASTLAELSLEQKNTVSHRGAALEKVIKWLLEN